METVKRLFISLLVLLGCSAGAWAIEQDSDGFYLIGSVQDWEDFAALVQTTPTANAKMTADVDLGDDQTRIGDVAGNEYGAKFGGIFDGQGHTLTVAYNITGQNMCAPFTKTNGATIKNLHVAGTMRTEFCHLAGIIADAYGNNTIENVWVSADLTSANNYNSGGRILDLCGAFVGCKKTGTLSISNGLFSGSITTENGSIWNGAFLGYIDGENQSSATITNCLSVGTFSYIEHETTIPNRGTNTYCYVKQFPTTIPSEMQVTDEQLADGTIAAALGDGWAQDPLTHQPVPKIFTTVQDEDGYYLIGSVQDWKRFADIVNSGTNPAANAKMTADVDLGDDQTYISPDWHGEFSNLHYHGTFDGQGHTLTVHYNSDKYFHTPFSQTSGATIKNLHVAGTIKSTSSGPSHMSGLISNSAGNDVIQNVWVSADITGGSHSWIECGAFIGCNNCGNTTITDCLFTGSITTTGGNNGCFAGWVQSYNPSSITTTNCLSTGTFNIGSGSVSRGTLNNCYVKSYPYSIPSAMQVTDEQLANGTTAAALQADRSEEIWVQDPVLGIPMLKIFANEETEQPSEALNGEFSITDNGIKVVFSRGNLQYVNDTWQFAKHQYDYFGENQSNGRDMFAFNDFSLPNSDDNWFNMTHDQWVYLLRDRSVTNTLSEGARFTMATLGGTYKGVILFPDNYTHPEGTGFTPGVFNSNSNYTAEVSLEGWALMEAAGCVFLPACGWNSAGSEWKSVGETAVYSTPSVYPTGSRYYTPAFYVDRIDFDEWCNRASWTPVRLVQLSGLNRDDDGYYLIGSVEDWKECSSLLTINPSINIRMTADFDLGDDQTELGSVNNPYKGTFDGQGHALTVAYSVTGSNSDHVAPFASIENATIENLHVKGTITTAGMRPAGITSYVSGTSYIRNCWSEVAITSSRGSDIDAGGFVARVNSGQTLHIDDCTFTGSIIYSYRSGFEAGGFVGWCQESGIVQIQNCLFAPTSIKTIAQSDDNKMFVSGYQSNVSFTNCYYRKVGSLEQWIEQGIATTEDELNDCITSVALQNGRSEDVWVQDPLTNQPLPIIFATLQDEDGNYLIGSVQDWKRFADIVKTTPTANAKMVADVDLGDDQTMVGDAYYNNASMRVPFSGVFDGQGHTLTIHYVTANMPTSQRFFGGAPFGYVVNGTIRNLHTAGTLTSSHEGVSGMIGYADGNTLIENCRSSVNITFTASYGGAGFVYWSHSNSSILTLRDCIYDGTITGSQGYNSGLVVWYPNGECRIENSLVAATFNGSSYNCCTFIRPANSNHTITNSYYKNAVGTVQGTPATADELSDGTTAAALQAGRTDEIWVLDPVLGTPMLKLFAKDITYTVPSSGIGTFSAKGQVLLPEGLKAYYCKTYHKKNSTISVVSISGNIVPAATGVLLVGNKGETFTLTGACGQAPTITDNELVAVTESKHVPATDGDYTNFMMKGGKFIKIQQDDESVKMPANRAYLPLLTSAISGSNAKEIMLYWDDEEATGVERMRNVENEIMRNGNIYNLNGQKLSAPQKGINIINGRKVIVK